MMGLYSGILFIATLCLVTFVVQYIYVGLLFQNKSSGGGDSYIHHDYDATALDCAQGVFITLHRVKDGAVGDGSNRSISGNEDHSSKERVCYGMLLRDDIILTSKECSRSAFIFDFPGNHDVGGRVDAVPYMSLNKKRDHLPRPLNTHLGFLRVKNPPYQHYHFLGRQPAKRMRMFQ